MARHNVLCCLPARTPLLAARSLMRSTFYVPLWMSRMQAHSELMILVRCLACTHALIHTTLRLHT